MFTPLDRRQIEDFLVRYDAGRLVSHEVIPQGVQNTNYHVFTDRGRYVMTLFEGQTVAPADLPFFFGFMRHLKEKGIACPAILRDREGKESGILGDRPAALATFLEGTGGDCTDGNCTAAGGLLARMHRAAVDFPMRRANGFGLARWKALAGRTEDRADEVDSGLAALIAEEIEYLEAGWPSGKLPEGAIHADFFPDNVFFTNGVLSGVIDFYFACTDFYVYDLALAVNAWCFDTDARFDAGRFAAFMDAYRGVRRPEDGEMDYLSFMGRAAALRILLTRLNDWLFHDPAHLVTPKDPCEYIAKLEFHRRETIGR